jgi:hypothetical protein
VGAAASGGDCGSGAMGAAASVVLNNLFSRGTSTATDADGKPLSLEAQQARENLVATLVGALSEAATLNTSNAILAAQIETQNNGLKGAVPVVRGPVFQGFRPVLDRRATGLTRASADGKTIEIGIDIRGIDRQFLVLPNDIGLEGTWYDPGTRDYHRYGFNFDFGPGESLMPLVMANPTPSIGELAASYRGSRNQAGPFLLSPAIESGNIGMLQGGHVAGPDPFGMNLQLGGPIPYQTA